MGRTPQQQFRSAGVLTRSTCDSPPLEKVPNAPSNSRSAAGADTRAPLKPQNPILIAQPCAAPWPLLRIAYQQRLRRIVLDIAAARCFVLGVPHVRVPVIRLPEGAASSKPLVRLLRGVSLPILQVPGHRRITSLEQHVNVVRHDYPPSQLIPLAVMQLQRIFHQLCDLRLTQVALPSAAIQINFQFFAPFALVLNFQQVLPFGTERVRETVGQAESHELGKSRFIAVRQVAALVPPTEAAQHLLAFRLG